LNRKKVEVRIANFGSDLLPLGADIFTSDVAAKLCCANSEANLVLLCQRLIDAASNK
jgi:hypothetical protein